MKPLPIEKVEIGMKVFLTSKSDFYEQQLGYEYGLVESKPQKDENGEFADNWVEVGWYLNDKRIELNVYRCFVSYSTLIHDYQKYDLIYFEDQPEFEFEF